MAYSVVVLRNLSDAFLNLLKYLFSIFYFYLFCAPYIRPLPFFGVGASYDSTIETNLELKLYITCTTI